MELNQLLCQNVAPENSPLSDYNLESGEENTRLLGCRLYVLII